MRMGVDLCRLSMGRPACVPDSASAGQGSTVIHLLGKIPKLSGRLYNLCQFFTVSYSESGRVIASVFQLGQPIQQNGSSVMKTCKTYNSAHVKYLLFRPSLRRLTRFVNYYSGS